MNQDRLQAARAKAPALGYSEEECDVCHGRGTATHADASAPQGKRTTDPCPQCRGYGRAWFEGVTRTILQRFTVDDILSKP